MTFHYITLCNPNIHRAPCSLSANPFTLISGVSRYNPYDLAEKYALLATDRQLKWLTGTTGKSTRSRDRPRIIYGARPMTMCLI